MKSLIRESLLITYYSLLITHYLLLITVYESRFIALAKTNAPSSDGEEAFIYFGNQAVMTFWVLDPWFCVPGFHQVCFSSNG